MRKKIDDSINKLSNEIEEKIHGDEDLPTRENSSAPSDQSSRVTTDDS